jgi:hypothetical protein
MVVDLSSIAVAVRPRSHWEATDLGCLMTRRWAKLVYGGWCVTALPIIALVFIGLSSMPTLAAIVVWWLKPVYERLPLWLLSQAIFGSEPRLSDALKNWRGVFLPQLLPALTVRRLSPTRSFDAPVSVLEGLEGVPRRDRLRVLGRTTGSPAIWLTVLGVHLEAFLAWSALVIVIVLVPAEVELDLWAILVGESGRLDWLLNAVYVIAITLVGPVYVAAGFSLYLNRRIELEGWDIELAFRRLVERAATVLLVAAVVSGALLPVPVDADEAAAAESRAVIVDVLADPAFNEKTSMTVPAFLKDFFEADESSPQQDISWLVELGAWLAAVGEVLIWIAVAGILIWVGYRVWLGIEGRRAPARDLPPIPARLMGLDLTAASLPEDPVVAARQAFQHGESRRAVSLLYRVALVELMTRHGCTFNDSATEGECVSTAQRQAPGQVFTYFARLTRAWQRLAYAHRTLDEGDFDRLCREWAQVWESDP